MSVSTKTEEYNEAEIVEDLKSRLYSELCLFVSNPRIPMSVRVPFKELLRTLDADANKSKLVNSKLQTNLSN